MCYAATLGIGGECGGTAPNHHSDLVRVKVGLLVRSHCFIGRICEVTNIYPSLKLMVFVDDITAFMNARTKELLELAEKVFKTLKKRGKSWEVNFKTEVCSKSTFLHLTMHWIKDVEIAKSIDDLLTSRSITGRTDFTDYELMR